MIAVIPGIPGPFELLLVAFIVLLLFGKKLPTLMRSLGSSVVEFKKGINDTDEPESDERTERD